MTGRIRGRLAFLKPVPRPGYFGKSRLKQPNSLLTFLEIGWVEREIDKLVDEAGTTLLPGGTINLIDNDANG